MPFAARSARRQRRPSNDSPPTSRRCSPDACRSSCDASAITVCEPSSAMTEPTQTREPPGTSTRPQGSTLIELEMPARWWIDVGSVPRHEAARACRQQALLLWPRLDPVPSCPDARRSLADRPARGAANAAVSRRDRRDADQLHAGVPDRLGTAGPGRQVRRADEANADTDTDTDARGNTRGHARSLRVDRVTAATIWPRSRPLHADVGRSSSAGLLVQPGGARYDRHVPNLAEGGPGQAMR